MRWFSRDAKRIANYLWAGLAIVVIGLSLGIQVEILGMRNAQFGTSGPTTMFNFSGAVASDIEAFYRTSAEGNLHVPAALLGDSRTIAEHFRAHRPQGIERFFTLQLDEQGGAHTMFFRGASDFSPEEGRGDEARAIAQACEPLIRAFTPGRNPPETSLMVVQRDEMPPVILQPISGTANSLAGIAGEILDIGFFEQQLLPRTVAQNVERFYPLVGRENVIVTASTEKSRTLFLNGVGEGKGTTISRPLTFVFTNWELKAQNGNRAPLQWFWQQYGAAQLITLLAAIIIVTQIILMMRRNLRAMKLSEMKAQFATNVSHELRTPVSSIKLFAEFLRLGRVTDRQQIQKYGEHIEVEAERLIGLIDKILNFAGMEAGRQQYVMEQANMSEVVTETLNALEPELQKNGFSIHLDLPPEPLAPIVVDKEAVSEVLINIVDNAVKYSTDHKQLTIRLRSEHGFIVLAIADRGIGVADEHREKIFEEFYRVNDGLVHRARGSGLGLAIAKRIVESHRGKITIDSDLGHGSTFTVYLPTGG